MSPSVEGPIIGRLSPSYLRLTTFAIVIVVQVVLIFLLNYTRIAISRCSITLILPYLHYPYPCLREKLCIDYTVNPKLPIYAQHKLSLRC